MAHKPLHISQFPRLQAWYEEHTGLSQSRPEHIVPYTQWQLCEALQKTADQVCTGWMASLSQLLETSSEPLEHYQTLESFFRDQGLSLAHLASEMAHHALSLELGPDYAALMEKAALKTGLVTFYFLAAWTALNADEPGHCIRLCQMVAHPYAPLKALHGQALLELGFASQALSLLEQASELDANEPLIWFQLAKAEMVLGCHETAWQTLEVLNQLKPGNQEVAMFYGILALSEPDKPSWHEQAWQALSCHLPQASNELNIVLPLLKIALCSSNRTRAQQVVATASWQRLKPQLLTSGQLGGLLGALGTKQWYDLANTILEALTAGP